MTKYHIFSEMISNKEPVKKIAEEYLKLEIDINNNDLLVKKLKETYNKLEEHGVFYPPTFDERVTVFATKMKDVFLRSIMEKKKIREISEEKTRSFRDLISTNDFNSQSSSLNVVDAFFLEIERSLEDRNEDYYHLQVSQLRKAFYDNFIEKIISKIPNSLEYFTANKGGLDHIAFCSPVKIGRLSRKEDESICSPKIDFSKESDNGFTNTGSVSCKKCIKNLVKKVVEPKVKIQLRLK